VTYCLAVGLEDFGLGGAITMERFDGSSWSPVTITGVDTSKLYQLDAVTCWAADHCDVVGDNSTSTASSPSPIEVFTLSGSVWTGTSLPTTVQSTPAAISCSDAGDCVVISNADAGVYPQFAEYQLAGGAWSENISSIPSESSNAQVTGLSCTAPGRCEVVGDSIDVTTNWPMPLVGELKGGTWTFAEIQNYFSLSALSGVSCTSTTSCTASGLLEDATGAYHDVVATFDGTSWHLAELADAPGTKSNYLTGISCTAADTCVAVGSATDGAKNPQLILDTEVGGVWTPLATPEGAGGPRINLTGSDVSCPTTTSCVVLGSSTFGEPFQTPTLTTFSYTYDMVSLTSVVPPALYKSPYSGLTGLSCPTASSCVAVGYGEPAFESGQPIVETLTGASWSPTVLTVPGAAFAALEDVACRTTTNCVAVGLAETTTSGFHEEMLIATLGSTGWSTSTANPPAASPDGIFDSISCPSPSRCVASGTSGGLPFVGVLGGAGWTYRTLPLPKFRHQVDFSPTAVDCASASYCVNVGSTLGLRPFYDVYNGTTWTMHAISLPSSVSSFQPYSVSCPAVGYCVAVGSNKSQSVVATLSGGRWHVRQIPPPSGYIETAVSAVACQGVGSCEAVGAVFPVGTNSPLVPASFAIDASSITVSPMPATSANADDELNSVCRFGPGYAAAGAAVYFSTNFLLQLFPLVGTSS
jgi:hypothetical protein